VIVILESNLPIHCLLIARVAVTLRLIRLRLKLLALQAALSICYLLCAGHFSLISVQENIVLAAIYRAHVRSLNMVLGVVDGGEV
jgi:hypothetical protein